MEVDKKKKLLEQCKALGIAEGVKKYKISKIQALEFLRKKRDSMQDSISSD
jgi:hypothetical protein